MRKWTRVILRYSTTQGAVQALGFAVGIVVVRSLEKTEYAQYAVALSIFAAVALVTDSGISSAVMSRGSKKLDDSSALSALIAGALKFRFRLALVVGVASSILLGLLLRQNDASLPALILYVGVVALATIPTLTKGVILNYLRLTLNFGTIQEIALVSAVLRLVAVGLLAWFAVLNVLVLLLVMLAAAWYEALRVRWTTRESLDSSAAADPADMEAFRINLRKTLPMTLLVVTQTQLLYLLISIMGTAENLADIAALSRFALVFVILNSVVVDIGAGVVARSPQTRRALRRVFGITLGGYLVSITLLIGAAWVFREPLLNLLGPTYAGLETPLIIVALGSAGINLGNALRTLNHARGWLRWSWLFAPMMVVWALSAFFTFDLTDSTGAAMFMAAQALTGLVTQGVCFTSGYRSTPPG